MRTAKGFDIALRPLLTGVLEAACGLNAWGGALNQKWLFNKAKIESQDLTG